MLRISSNDRMLISLALGLIVVVAVVEWNSARRSDVNLSREPPTATAAPKPTENQSLPASSGHTGAASLYPEASVTGATDSRVNQANIRDTICKRGYSASVRPPNDLIKRLKLERFESLHAARDPSDYEFDHFIPLELGGCPDCKSNLWLEPIADALRKDVVENHLHQEVCEGRMSLAEAQNNIARDWYAIYLEISGTSDTK